MAANLYARSIFGEDALANVSIEKPSDQSGPSVTGHVRIRAKSQVIDVCFAWLPPPPMVTTLFQTSTRGERVYSKILDRDWFSARLFAT